jgi:peptidoglycan hydrolase CwlO-like protein
MIFFIFVRKLARSNFEVKSGFLNISSFRQGSVVNVQTMKTKLIVLLAATALASGCTTFTKSECEQMNWAQTGARAAMQGHSLDYTLRYYNQTCMDDNGVIPDQALIQRGFADGLVYFCSENNLRAHAANGGGYPVTCEMTDQKKAAFKEGHQDFIESEVSRLREQVGHLQNRVSNLETENSNLKSELDRTKH